MNRPATVAVPADLWDEIRDFIDQHVDVCDGADGPRPNDAMSLSQQIENEGLAQIAAQSRAQRIRKLERALREVLENRDGQIVHRAALERAQKALAQ